MVIRKRNEAEFGAMMRQRYHYFAHKWRDRGYVSCPHCHRPVKKCPHCYHDMLLEKAQSFADYLVAFSWADVEAKQGGESWAINDFSPTQLKVMHETHEGWLFLELGMGSAPSGRGAWLVYWPEWERIQEELEGKGVGSLRFEASPKSRMPLAKDELKGWELEWKDGGWAIPDNHYFWTHRQGEEDNQNREQHTPYFA